MNVGEVGLKVLESRYLLKDANGKLIETPDQLVARVATAIGKAEFAYVDKVGKEQALDNETLFIEECKRWMGEMSFLPNSPTLMNAGVPGGQLSACFVLPVNDDIESIFDAVKDMAMIFKSGGGVGLPMSRLRQKGALVKSTGGVSSGPVSFMRVYNITAEVVAQGGKRRGALMGTLRIDHPDILEFIKVKQDLSQLTSFNLSVAVTDEFMQALADGGDFALRDPRDGSMMITVPAQDIWNDIVECAWKTGEPGLVFIDRINAAHRELTGIDEEIEGTNPCGEVPLLGYESCNLGSINLANFVARPFTDEAHVDYDGLKAVAGFAVRFLDNVITVNNYPLPDIRQATLKTRKIGLGVMGFAEMLLQMGVRYGTMESRDILGSVLKYIQCWAHATSAELAVERGVYAGASGERKRRNATLTAIAPTGSISMIAGVTGGIEPMFSIVTRRESVLDGKPFIQANETVRELLYRNGYNGQNGNASSDEVITRLGEGVSFEKATGGYKSMYKYVVCSHEVAPDAHVDMQAEAQKYVDNAVSKCLAEGTLVQTNQGVIPIERLGRARGEDSFGEPIQGLKVIGHDGLWHDVTAHYSGGVKPVASVRLKCGASICGSDEHRVMTLAGWKRLGDLNNTDYVQVRRADYGRRPCGMPIEATDECRIFRTNAVMCRLPERMNGDLAKFLGMMAADGYTTIATGKVAITYQYDYIGLEFRRLVKTLFGLETKCAPNSENSTVEWVTSRSLARYIESLIGHGAWHKRVPSSVLMGSTKEQVAFLSGLSLDGYRLCNSLVVYSGRSKMLTDGVAAMLWGMGDLPRCGSKDVPIYGGLVYEVRTYSGLIDPIDPHKRCEEKADITELVSVPVGIGDVRLPCSDDRYSALRSIRQRGASCASRRVVEALGFKTDHDVSWWKVASIERGESAVYDIEVADVHSYVVSGIVSHNTVNLPHEAERRDVYGIFLHAYDSGCKGITVYRDGCREHQPMSAPVVEASGVSQFLIPKPEDVGRLFTPFEDDAKIGEGHAEIINDTMTWEDVRIRLRRLGLEPPKLLEEGKIREDRPEMTKLHMKERPETLAGHTVKMKTGCGTLFVTVSTDEQGNPVELFAHHGKAGICSAAQCEAIGRLSSMALRSGVDPQEIIGQLRGITCHEPSGMGPSKVLSCADGIAQAIAKALDARLPRIPVKQLINAAVHNQMVYDDDDPEATRRTPVPGGRPVYMGACPDCGAGAIREAGCVICSASCGWKKCT